MSLELEARHALRSFTLDVALSVAPGECLALAGPSGAGKSTVLRIVAGLLRPDAGRVRCGDDLWLDRERGVALPPEQRACGYVFQHYALFPHLSAARNVAYGLRGGSRAQRRTTAIAALERFGIGQLADARPRALSGGERQRVALARAVVRRPRALLLDEPLTALDATTRGQATRALGELLREHEVPAILVTHDFVEAATLGTTVAIVDRGRIVQRGAPAEVAARPATPFVAGLTGAVVLTGVASSADHGLAKVALDGGGTVLSTDPVPASGGAATRPVPVAVTTHPWEITLHPVDERPGDLVDVGGSARNALAATVTAITPIGNRVRVGLDTGQPLAAEVTGAAIERLGLQVGDRVTAAWKASATRVLDRGGSSTA